MKRFLAVAGFTVALSGADVWAQAVPDHSQASQIESGYRRPLNYRMDPFRNIFAPRWGVVIAAGAWAENNSLNLKDVRALEYIDNNDTLLITDLLDVLGLIPPGQGLGLSSVSEGGVYVGGPIGDLLKLGVSAQGRAYGGGIIDDDAIAPFRDGNGTRQEFALGNSRGEGLATGEVGLHALFNFGPLGSAKVTHCALLRTRSQPPLRSRPSSRRTSTTVCRPSIEAQAWLAISWSASSGRPPGLRSRACWPTWAR